jgi:transposase InsO family protein
VIELHSRRVHIIGSTPHPDEAFVLQAARHLTDATDGILQGRRFLICDRDRKWSTAVQHLLETSGLRVIQTPFRAPNCNAYAERFVRSIKEECLNRVIPLGERHFRRTLVEFLVHYHRKRNHQGLGNDLIDGVGDPLLAAIGHVARPSWRASSVGVYRLWRDLGYAIGALLAGMTADAFGLPPCG